jgi:hypothetical protein
MNLDLKTLPQKLYPMLNFVRRYLVLLSIVAFVIACGYLVMQINSLVRSEPSDDAVSEKLKTVQRPHIDQKSIDKIQQLQDQNIEVRSLFEAARDNPFSE